MSIIIALTFIASCLVGFSAGFRLRDVDLNQNHVLDCQSTITTSGTFIYSSSSGSEIRQCKTTVFVPSDSSAFLNIHEEECDVLSSPNITIMCDQPTREYILTEGEYFFYFDSAEMAAIRINFTELLKYECNDIAKNLVEHNNKLITLKNTERSKYCMLRLPSTVKIEFLDYKVARKKKCCPEVFVVSTDHEENIVENSEPVSACDIATHAISTSSKCDQTWMYLTGAAFGDELTFKVTALPMVSMFECLRFAEVQIKPETMCRKRNTKLRMKRRS